MMADRDEVERQIRDVLAAESTAISLSDKLFRPDGLFNQIAKTEAERRALTQSPLFQEAQQRLSDLQWQEAARFAEAIRQARGKASAED